MFPAATLVVDVCVQVDFWPGGAWPLVDAQVAENVTRLFGAVATLPVRRGGVACRHERQPGSSVDVRAPLHCEVARAMGRPPEILARDPTEHVFETGCGLSLDNPPHRARFLDLVAGIRDAVVFGAGLEYGVAHVVEALLGRRVRTHLVIDAIGSASDVDAQVMMARWKRRGVDVVTVQGVERLLTIR